MLHLGYSIAIAPSKSTAVYDFELKSKCKGYTELWICIKDNNEKKNIEHNLLHFMLFG